MFKKINYLIVLIVAMFLYKNVYASTYYDVIDEHGEWIANEFITKEKNGSKKYQQMTKIIRKSDERFLYCIEPGKSIEKNKTFTGYDTNQQQYANISDEDWLRIRLLAYYGYGYKDSFADHTDIKWYVITQFMIWKTNDLGYDIYFTDKLNGNRIEKYTQEMIELDNLVNSHFTLPSFTTTTQKAFIDTVTEFTDKNNVLENYDVKCTSTNYCIKYKNYFDIKLTDYNDINEVIFTKKINDYSNEPIVYIDNQSQNLLLPGKVPGVRASMKIDLLYGTISLIKYDKDTLKNKPQNDATLEGAEYGLYNNNDSLLEIKKTDKFGKLTFNSKLKIGTYYVKEITPSEGYNLDSTKYNVNITYKDYNNTLKVYEEIIKENFEIIKILDDEKTGLSEFEKNIEFGIYDKNNNLINRYYTDDIGTIKFQLNYGEYVFKQHTMYDNYESIPDYNICVKENNKYNKLVFKDKVKEEPKTEVKKEVKKDEIKYTDNSLELTVDVPNTFKDDTNYFDINVLLFLIIKKLWLF